MSYTTRCPACGTMFRVVPDQLKISDGWVRCGHCADVFDATLYLEAWVPPPAQALAPTPPPSPAAHLAALPSSVASEAPVQMAAPADAAAGEEGVAPTIADMPSPPEGVPPRDADDADQPVTLGLAGAASATEAEAVLQADEASLPEEGPQWTPVVSAQGAAVLAQDEAEGEWLVHPRDALSASADTDADVQLEPVGAAADLPQALSVDAHPAELAGGDTFQAELNRFAEAAGRVVPAVVAPAVQNATPATTAFVEPDDVVAVHEAGEPGFMRQARRQAFWRSPAVRAVLGLVAGGLGLLLLLQWTLHERDTLAARHPVLTPLLARLCEPLGCEVGPVRRIDAVVIDSSTLVRRLGNFYAFDVVLKNTADIPLAVPALELSLTDTRDSVMARRVFLPHDLPGALRVLPARSSQPLSLRLSISEMGGVPMAGYRALVFYP